MSKNPWNPVEQFKDDTIDCSVSIKNPPCSTCWYWKPHKKFKQRGPKIILQGIVCCSSSLMLADFSCYREKNDE